MDRVYWEERVKTIPDDMNALHENTEGALGNLIEAMAGNIDTVLFKDAPPVVTHPASTLLTNIPEQWFSVDGVFCKIPASSDSRPDTADYISFYFVAYRTDVNGTRDRYTLAGGVVTVAPETVIIRKPSNCRIEITASGNPLTPPGPPTLGPNDIGYIKYCDVVWDGATLTVTHNVSALWSFPGAGISYTPHAATHLPTGTDPIQLAGLGGDPLGSRPGLMPSGSYATLMGSLQDVTVDPTASCLTRSLSGDNSPGNPKHVALNLNYDDSLKVHEVSSIQKLGLNYRTGPYSGEDDRPARFDHTHSPGDSPIILDAVEIEVDSGDLGSELPVPVFDGMSKIHTAQVFWIPPLSNDDPYPMFQCSWMIGSSGTVGARVHIVGAKTVVLETGGVAYTELGTATSARATAAVGGTPTWTYAGYVTRPTSGILLVKVVGER